MLGTCEDPPEYEVEISWTTMEVSCEGCISLNLRRSTEGSVYGSCDDAAVARGSERVLGSREGRRSRLPEGDGAERPGRGW